MAEGLQLACSVCRWRPGADLPMGLVAAHFETEHGIAAEDIRLDLVAVCARCQVEMPHVHTTTTATGLLKHRHQCPTCHRTQIITQRPEGDDRG